MSSRFRRAALAAAFGALVLLLLLFAAWRLFFSDSKERRAERNARNSEAFGDALQRAGIPSQAGPSSSASRQNP